MSCWLFWRCLIHTVEICAVETHIVNCALEMCSKYICWIWSKYVLFVWCSKWYLEHPRCEGLFFQRMFYINYIYIKLYKLYVDIIYYYYNRWYYIMLCYNIFYYIHLYYTRSIKLYIYDIVYYTLNTINVIL